MLESSKAPRTPDNSSGSDHEADPGGFEMISKFKFCMNRIGARNHSP